jgi:hypothetical protein
LRVSFVHHEVAIAEKATVEEFDGLCRFFLGGHLHEPEPARSTRELVRNDPDCLHGTGLREQLAEIIFCRLEGEVADKKLSGHRGNLLPSTERRTEPET